MPDEIKEELKAPVTPEPPAGAKEPTPVVVQSSEPAKAAAPLPNEGYQVTRAEWQNLNAKVDTLGEGIEKKFGELFAPFAPLGDALRDITDEEAAPRRAGSRFREAFKKKLL